MNNRPLRIFVVEDDEWYQKLLVHTLSLNPDHQVTAFNDGQAMLDELKSNPDLITLDFRLPDFTGADLFDKIQSFNPDIPVVIISEQQDIETAVSLLKKGAHDYLTKTDDIRDRLVHLLNQLGKNRQLEAKVVSLQEEVERKYDFQKSIIGQSEDIKRIFHLMEKAISTNITVMISGETGTGKEVVAKAIHYNSKQRKGAFVPVNMGAIPRELVESELFGHEKGAFTGAMEKRIGKFEQAKGGTLFLDEIGEMDISIQAKLLRALQEKEVVRVGGSQVIPIDCRVVVATHRNLLEEMKKGTFREDLYYRLYGLPIELPPLRSRDKDVLLLAKYFADSFAKDNDQPTKSFTKKAKQKLLNYSFPGNVRELKSAVELAMVMTDNEEIGEDDIAFAQRDVVAEVMGDQMTMRDYQMKIIRLYLKQNNDDIKAVADQLNIGQSTIYRLLKEHS